MIPRVEEKSNPFFKKIFRPAKSGLREVLPGGGMNFVRWWAAD
jgi:hypothetical protein